MAFYRCAGGTDPTGNAGTGDVLAGKTFSNADGIDKTGTMPNQGAKTASLNTGTTSYTIPAGYHNGSGKVSITTQEKTVTSSRSAQTVTPDSGKVLSKVTVNALAPSGTYKPTSRANNNDMGATGNYRYVDTTAVPNTNSGTYTYAANSTGGTVDMGATNTYRYVNAANVYAKGKADGISLSENTYIKAILSNDSDFNGTPTKGTGKTITLDNSANAVYIISCVNRSTMKFNLNGSIACGYLLFKGSTVSMTRNYTNNTNINVSAYDVCIVKIRGSYTGTITMA